MYKETSRNYRGELANRSWELKNEDKIATCYGLKKKKGKTLTYQPHSAILTYSDKLSKLYLQS